MVSTVEEKNSSSNSKCSESIIIPVELSPAEIIQENEPSSDSEKLLNIIENKTLPANS